uniref:Uncharacterized protein n=1 Tax=Daucus carota subsp. sativus TaxID=79200 RepID=A0A175YFW4_DAUCS
MLASSLSKCSAKYFACLIYHFQAAEEVEGFDDFENKQKVISTESSLSFCKNNRKPS